MIYPYGILPMLKAYGWLRRDDECAHELAFAAIKAMQRVPGLMGLIGFAIETMSKAAPREVFGIRFRGPLGLAAGLDKDGVGLPFWEATGLAFAEVGTVTPFAQPGNPRKRVFRLDREQMMINRLGFNSPGMMAVRDNLFKAKRRVKIPVGISLGRMRDTPDEEAHLDYTMVLMTFIALVEFIIANISSPNTPGLRDLQKKAFIERFLRHLIACAAREAEHRGIPRRPLLVKVAPDLTLGELDTVIDAILATGADGLVIGNTTTERPFPIPRPLEGVYAEKGGASGGDWLFDQMLGLGRHARRYAPLMPLILVGGIDSAEKARKALDVGDLIEVLTGFVFQGPALVSRINRACAAPHAPPYVRPVPA